MWWKCLSQQSIKFKVSPSGSNAAVVLFLDIDLLPPLLVSSTYVGCCLSWEVIEHMRLYLSVLEFIIKHLRMVPWSLEHMAVLYHGTLFKQPGWLFYSMSYFICLFGDIIQDKPTWCIIVFNTNLVIIYSTFNPLKINQCFYDNRYTW